MCRKIRNILVVAVMMFAMACPSLAAINMDRMLYTSLVRYINTSVDPCEDYYAYACGKWKNFHEGEEYFEALGFMDHNVNEEYCEILRTVKELGWEKHDFTRKAADYFQACDSVDSYKPNNYLVFLAEKENITWPTILPSSNSSDEHEFDWLTLLAIMRKYGMNGIFIEETLLPHPNSSELVIDIDKPVIAGGFTPMESTDFQRTLSILGIKNSPSLWHKVHTFETKLKKLDDVKDHVGRQVLPLSELNMAWLARYLDTVFEAIVDRNTSISIQNLEYIEELHDMLAEYSTEFIARYLMLRFTRYLDDVGPTSFTGENCASHLRSMMPHAMQWMYAAYKPELANETEVINALFKTLIEQFKEIIEENMNDFSADVLTFLYKKLEAMKIQIGAEESAAALEHYYKSLTIDAVDFYANHLNMLYHYNRARHGQLYDSTLRKRNFFLLESHDSGSSSSPYYVMYANMVIVPVTTLNPPLYAPGMTGAFKYGGFGYILAHEILHGFDETGVQFDRDGNIRGPSDAITQNFRFGRRMKCLSERGEHILDEKIADVSGLRSAFRAYKKLADRTAVDSHFQWTEFSADRLFFLNFAQFFCGIDDIELAPKMDPHGTDRDRVIDTLANFDEFAHVHRCPVGSPMNPAKRCQLWR